MTALSNRRVNPIDGSTSWRTMDHEGHTIAELAQLPGVYGFQLQDRPKSASISIAETGTGATSNFTLVTTTPTGARQAYIDYETGLVICHISNNGDYVEVSYEGGGSIATIDLLADTANATLTTKGDLLTRTASGFTRFAIGANATFLGADSSQTTGLYYFAGPTSVRLTGCVPTNAAGDTARDIDFSAGFIFGSDGKWYTMAARTAKQLDAAFAQGNSAGGLDTGAIAANTFYYPHAIIKDSDGSTDWLLSTSASSPTVPSGWTKVYSATEWFFRTDGSSNIRNMIYSNNGWMQWKTPPQLDIDSSSVTTARTTFSILAPAGRWIADCSQYMADAGANIVWSNPDMTDQAPSVTAVPLVDANINTAASDGTRCTLITDASAQLSVRATAAVSDTRLCVKALRNVEIR